MFAYFLSHIGVCKEIHRILKEIHEVQINVNTYNNNHCYRYFIIKNWGDKIKFGVHIILRYLEEKG